MISLFLLALPIFSSEDSDSYSSRNQLGSSSSPYLLQHAENPVHWLPWGEEAFAEARRLDRPILVSIGYSTCHWCHVMEGESFEDPATAALMNKFLINIKVDREQLPGVDAFYMEAASIMGGSTGWPLNVFVDTDGKPFYAGTYYPNEQWKSLINRVGELWQTNRAELIKAGSDLTENMERYSERSRGNGSASGLTKEESESIISSYLASLGTDFNDEFPGFPSAGGTQFPPSTNLSFLLEYQDSAGMDMSEKILETMQNSGLHDRVGGGFHRYTTDIAWRVPHFEKMLYDNVQLMGLYARGSVLFRRDDFLQTAVNIGDYLMRDMKIEDTQRVGYGYATAEDADDPAGEGAFYAWSPADLRAALNKEDAEYLIRFWNLQSSSEQRPGDRTEEPVAGWIPYPLGAGSQKISEKDIQSLLPILRERREKRPRPLRDDKVLTDLNSLALEGFSLLARVSQEERFIKEVEELTTFLIRRYNQYGIIRTYGIVPYITDYAYMILGLTSAYQLLEDPALIDIAIDISLKAVEELGTGSGTFYSSSEGDLNLPVRKVDPFDSQIPSGLSSMALGYARLYSITGDELYREQAKRIIGSQSEFLNSYPRGFPTLLRANLLLERSWHIVLAGNTESAVYKKLKEKLLYLLGTDYPLITAGGKGNESWVLLDGRKDLEVPQVLICNDKACLLPIENPSDLEGRLIEAGIFL